MINSYHKVIKEDFIKLWDTNVVKDWVKKGRAHSLLQGKILRCQVKQLKRLGIPNLGIPRIKTSSKSVDGSLLEMSRTHLVVTMDKVLARDIRKLGGNVLHPCFIS